MPFCKTQKVFGSKKEIHFFVLFISFKIFHSEWWKDFYPNFPIFGKAPVPQFNGTYHGRCWSWKRFWSGKRIFGCSKDFLPHKTKVSLLLFIISLLLLSHFHVYCVGIYSQHSLAGKMHVELDCIENRVNNTNPHEKRNEMPHFGASGFVAMASPIVGVRSVDGLTYCILWFESQFYYVQIKMVCEHYAFE